MHGCSRGSCVVALGGCVVAPGGRGGCVHGCSGGHAWLLLGACVVAPRGACMVTLGGRAVRGCSGGAWLLQGEGVCGCSRGACMVALGGMHGCSRRGMRGCSGGHAWLLGGVMCGCSRGGGVCGFSDEIRSMSRQYASYWNAFLFFTLFETPHKSVITIITDQYHVLSFHTDSLSKNAVYYLIQAHDGMDGNGRSDLITHRYQFSCTLK